jgi:hypothetical protein
VESEVLSAFLLGKVYIDLKNSKQFRFARDLSTEISSLTMKLDVFSKKFGDKKITEDLLGEIM